VCPFLREYKSLDEFKPPFNNRSKGERVMNCDTGMDFNVMACEVIKKGFC
jgi:hypothetical protein